MHIVESVETALHACVLLAATPPERGLSAARLAEYHARSPTSVAKQLQELAAAGIVAGTPGRSGGYRLTRPASEISVLSIVQAIDGDEAAFRCAEIRRSGPCAGPRAAYAPVCAIARTMHRAEAAWRSELERTTLADLAGAAAAQVDPAIGRRTAAWLEQAAR
jgi:Rrf2 family protein